MTRPCRCDSAGIFLSAFSAPPLVSTSHRCDQFPQPPAPPVCATVYLIAAAHGLPCLEKAMYRTDIEPRQGVISVGQRYSC